MDLRAVLVPVVGVVGALAQSAAHAQSYLLSAPLAPGQDVREFEVSPDGRWAVYSEGRLHSVSVRGDAHPHRLDERPVFDVGLISPDSRWVVYGAVEGGTSVVASVRIDGSAPPLTLEARGHFKITPDSRTVVTRALAGLEVVPIDRVAEALHIHPTEFIDAFVLTPDGRKVVYVIEGINAGGGLLYAAELDGSSPPVRLNTGATMAYIFDDYLLVTPDSSRLVYLRGRHSVAKQLYSVPLDGSASPVRLSPQNVDWYPWLVPSITADGTVVFKHSITSDDVYAVPAAGGVAPLPLNADGLVEAGSDYGAGPNGFDVLFLRGAGFEFELYRVPIDASAPPLALTGSLGSEQNIGYYELDPAGQVAAFIGRANDDDSWSIWSVPIDGSSAPLRLADLPHTAVFDDFGLEFTPDGSRIVYTAVRQLTGFELEDAELRLFVVPVDGSGAPVRLDGPMARGGRVRYTPFLPSGLTGGIVFRVTANGKRVVYIADQRDDEVFELFGAELPAPFKSERLPDPRVPTPGRPGR
jgi:Tol biopolymer transport system component